MLQHILFDLDNTLYPASSGLDQEISRRMTAFVAGLLGIAQADSERLRREEAKPYGTTLAWLIARHGFTDIEAYLAAVHPVDVGAWIAPDPDLTGMLASLEPPKSILTNSPLEHARRVMDRLGIAPCFENVFDLRWNGYKGKPRPEAYRRILDYIGAPPESVLFVDDLPHYLEPFRDMGGRCVLVDESGTRAAPRGVARIARVTELTGLLKDQGLCN